MEVTIHLCTISPSSRVKASAVEVTEPLCAEEDTQMVRKLLQTLTVVLAVLFLMATVALAAEMTCTVADANGCTMAKGGDGKEEKVTAPWCESGRQDELRRQGDVHEEAHTVVSPSCTGR